MKTAKAIVAFIREQGVGNKSDVDLLDNLLHERAKVLSGQPAEKLEWLLAWTVNGVHSATLHLKEAADDDAKRAQRMISMVRLGEALPSSRGNFSNPHSGVDVRAARLEDADTTMRRVLNVYEALAVDPPGAE